MLFRSDTNTGERVGTGADDKNGILVALEMLNHFNKIKIFFSVGEEIGCVGSGKVDLEFFKDVAYILQCDRRGNTNLITKTNGIEVMSDEMFAEMLDICEEYGYSEESGTSTDVGCLLKRGIGVSGCNISCGYFSEHTGNELTHIPSLENCMNLVYHFITTLGCVKYDHVPKPSYTSYVNYGTGHSTYSGGYNSKYANKAY